MKRLYEIETLLLNNQLQNIPAKTAFYSYLVKDNYNTNLLNDFLEHYNSSFLDTGTIFAKLKKYIEEDKLKFKVNYENNTLLPYGGLYRVELEINRTNENLYSLFNGPQLNSEIVVNLVPIRRANNYNPFYELPFDGEVGDARNGYGVGGTSNLKLREGVNAKNASTALKQINYLTSTNPAVTDTGIVLDYDISTNEFVFVPSQPTPVEITVTRNNNSNAQLRYEVNGFSATTLPAKTWKLRTSTIGDTKCHDFENQDKQTFIESKSGAIHRVTWNKLRNGTLGLTTTFFTPKALSEPINITPVNESTSVFNSYSIVKQNTSVFLKYYDNRGITSYDTINGLFDLIKDEKMAISLTPSRVKIFWNPQYLEELEEEVISNSGYSCD